MKSIAVVLALLFMSNAHARVCDETLKAWDQLGKTEQVRILEEVEFISPNELPAGIELIRYTDGSKPFDVSKVSNKAHKAYIDKIVGLFDIEVSREEIENSPFQPVGEAIVTAMDLLVACDRIVVGAVMSRYQEGVDEDGETGDINWSASVRFDENGEIHLDENGMPIDDLVYQWSGH